ncbi:MAG: tRNA uridine(34) 5-carboxymethylaminomethyl modification radical SAM/GNAT enzyme Elp3 [Candidatus Heimdallarchaeaceae archaeon]
MNDQDRALNEIKNLLLNGDITSKKDLDKIKRGVSKKYTLKRFPRNSEILELCTAEEREKLLPVLMKRRVRTLSGVAVVAIMTRPWPCPHGKCIMCPGGPDIERPQSYTGYEPTTMRGIRNNYDPFLQTSERIRQLHTIGHSTEKIDAIIMGGTFTNQPLDYQEWFILRMFDAMNEEESTSIQEALKKNEKAKHRCIGLTVETRPDQVNHEKIDRLLDYGVTRLEIGVQTVFDDIYQRMERGHGTKETISAFRFAKDSGLKITAHMMPGLPGSSFQRDIDAFHILFNDSNYKPDELKIYPTMVIPGTKLYDEYQKGNYQAYSNEETANLIARIKEFVPPYVRIKRVLRDIPAHQVAAGPNKSDLRLDIQKILREQGKRCRCIRCREVGHVVYQKKGEFNPEAIHFVQRTYNASGGVEHFLSFEDIENDVLIGFLRLRECSDEIIRQEFEKEKTIVVRELHIYGESLALNDLKKSDLHWQHRGYGKQLLARAEEIGLKKGYEKIAVISGVGVREYYGKLGYKQDGSYMSKRLK